MTPGWQDLADTTLCDCFKRLTCVLRILCARAPGTGRPKRSARTSRVPEAKEGATWLSTGRGSCAHLS